tara:strand:+ start:6076 stop:6486 length:411 start_codon:yes stop_codon:yes gene_type:complete
MSDINKIKRNKKNIIILFRFCIISLIISSSIFLFYIIDGKNITMNIVKQKDIHKKSSKLMNNPKIRFENDNGNFYDIKGKAAKYNSDGTIIAHQVTAISNSGIITSDRLDITNDGNVIIFTGNSNLEFYSTSKFKK